jgi:hypothetical protein
MRDDLEKFEKFKWPIWHTKDIYISFGVGIIIGILICIYVIPAIAGML